MKQTVINFFFHSLAIFCLSILIFSSTTATAAAAQNNETNILQAEPFSDPSYQVQMPKEWLKLSPPNDPNHISINLDQQFYRILLPSLKEYAKEHKFQLTVTDSTCGNSSGMLRRKNVSIGTFCCPPGFMDRFPGLVFHTTAITPLALIVHPDNPISNITITQARKIFMGEIRKWSELKAPDGRPGPDVAIKPVARLHCKKRPGHWRSLLANEDLFSLTMTEVGKISDMVYRIAKDPYAIGHVSPWLAKYYYSKDTGAVKLLKINGSSPNNLNALLKGDYPLYKTFSITTWEDETTDKPVVTKLANFIISLVEKLDDSYLIIPASQLKKGGWVFKDNELIGESR